MITDYTKQIELIDVSKIDTDIHVIGCGALGSWITFFLLKMGFNNIHVYDFDDIEEHNLPNQMFKESHIGLPKVSAMEDMYNDFFDDSVKRVTFHNQRIGVQDVSKMKGILISAVDSMKVRKTLFNAFKLNRRFDLFIEGRLSIFGAYIYTITKQTDYSKYEATLYDDTEAEVSACGVSQTALPAAVNASTIIIMQLIQFLNGEKVLNKLEYSIPWLDCMKGEW